MLTEKEMDAICFYQGDVRRKTRDGGYSDRLKEKGFFGIQGAYRTMNCLMFDGIENERERLAEKENSLNPEIFREIEKVVEVFCDIFRAMCKSAAEHREEAVRILYRTDRGVSVRKMQEKRQTISFTSTSKENRPIEFFKQKKKLTLLEIIVPPGTPYLDFEKELGGDYYFASQREVLLPPFLKTEFFEGKLTAEEEAYQDADGQPPQGKYLVLIKEFALQGGEETNGKCCPDLRELTAEKENAAAVLAKLSKEEELTEQEIQKYCEWKKKFQKIILKKFREIQNECMAQDNVECRKKALAAEVNQMVKAFDDRRKSYKRKMRNCNIALAVTGVVPLVCMALSFIPELELAMKVAAILVSATAVFFTRYLKAEAYHMKLFQRTKTCLNLYDLSRQMRYEHQWNEQKVDEYVRKFREIMAEDTGMSLQNLQFQIDNEDNLFQNEIAS